MIISVLIINTPFTAGGGTVDLITYKVKRISPHLELTELVPGTGSMVGSLVLNKRFEETVRLIVGDKQFARLKKSPGWAKAINEFDKTIKTAFDGDVTDIHYVNFPRAELVDDPAEGLVNNCWEMTGDTLQGSLLPHMRSCSCPELFKCSYSSLRKEHNGTLEVVISTCEMTGDLDWEALEI